MDSPALDWQVEATQTARLRLMNWISPGLPLSTWKAAWLLHVREFVARRSLGMGPMRLRCPMPSGHIGTLCLSGCTSSGRRRRRSMERISVARDTPLRRPTSARERPEIQCSRGRPGRVGDTESGRVSADARGNPPPADWSVASHRPGRVHAHVVPAADVISVTPARLHANDRCDRA
jgi:hypothetical protein